MMRASAEPLADSTAAAVRVHAPGLLDGLSIAGRPYVPLALIAVAMNSLVFFNAVMHDPTVGYDARDHLRYIATLASGRLVTPSDSDEFFSPPLPYVLPALAMRLGGLDLSSAGKVGQLLNVLLSIGTTLYVLRLCHLINPNGRILKLGALGFLAIVPVYYKTFSFVRGEPYVVLFATAAAYYAALVIARPSSAVRAGTALGAAMGCAALSRQWGILLVPAIAAMLGLTASKPGALRSGVAPLWISLGVGCAISGWFFLSLHHRYGAISAFNRAPQPSLAVSNQPRSFYLGSGLPELFTNPTRDAFPNQLLPIFYSETWGDYWGYFVFSRKEASTRVALDAASVPGRVPPNREQIAPYLGRVNAVSIPASLLAGAAVLAGITACGRLLRHRSPDVETRVMSLLLLMLVSSYAGYLWFLTLYPSFGKGDTIKASYMLHTFPFIAVLVGCLLSRLGRRSPRLQIAVAAILPTTFLHNLPAMLTHFWP
jgi:hypothetical protein